MTRNEVAHADDYTVLPGICHRTQGELARRWRISPRTLERWRAAGTGPGWLRVGGRVLYRMEDVLAFEEAQLRCGDGPIR